MGAASPRARRGEMAPSLPPQPVALEVEQRAAFTGHGEVRAVEAATKVVEFRS